MRTLGDLSWQYGIHFGTEILRVALKGDDLCKVKIMNDMVIHSTVITKAIEAILGAGTTIESTSSAKPPNIK